MRFSKSSFTPASGSKSRYFASYARLFGALFLTILVGACGTRPESGFLLPVANQGPATSSHTILVATTRQRDERPGTLFNGERAQRIDFAEIAVSVPPNHQDGEIEWASEPPGDPAKTFAVRKAAYLDGEKAFIAALNAQLALRPKGQRRIFLFVHGYNTMFAESVYRFAQLIHDSKGQGVPVLFTWASRGQLTQYVYDNNSATAARDDLERTIRLIFASNAEQVNILAHSMGNWVTVEALRQIKMTGGLANSSKLGNLFLAAPDIDIDVFKSQMRRFGKPAKPFYIIVSKDDKALGISNFLAGGQSRLGADANTAELAELGATVIDMTDVKALDSSNHGKFAQLAAVAPQLEAALERGIRTHRTGASAGEIAGNSLEAIVKLPITLITAPLRAVAEN